MLSEKPWKPDGLLLLVLGLLLSLSLLMSATEIVRHFMHAKPDDNPPVLLVLQTLSLHASIFISVFFFLRAERMSWADAFGFKTPGIRRALLWGAIVAIVFTPVGQGLNYLCARALESLHFAPATEQAVETMQQAAPGFSRIYVVFFAVVIAPVGEEMLFRGILYPAIKQFGFPRAAVLSSSFLFAAIHFNLPAFLPLMLLGIVLVILYEQTNNLLSCIFAHGLFNAIAAVMICFSSHAVVQQPY